MTILGLDVGIASIGWAVIEMKDGAGRIVAAGTWMFDAPEEKGQTGTRLKSELRRVFRGQRRVVRRRAQRMALVRRIMAEAGLLPTLHRDALKIEGLDPWPLRKAGLERRLDPKELAVALGHIARHRGFKSNAKDAKGTNSADDSKKMLKASAETREKLARYGTPARMLLEDEAFILRRTKRKSGEEEIVRRLHNRDGDYSRSLLRDDLATEVRDIFHSQRRLGNAQASEDLERGFTAAAFFQRPLQDSESLVADCPFEKGEKRAARRAYSFELFRFISRLNALTLSMGRETRRLTPEDIAKAAANFGHTAKISFAALRKVIGIGDDVKFDGISKDDEKRDVVARSGEAAAGTSRLRKLVIDNHGAMAWGALTNHPERLDRIAEIISFRNDFDSIAKGLAEIELDESLRKSLLGAVEAGDLDEFTKAGHISAKAARAILPGLLEGLTYDKAAAAAGYDHTASRERHAFDVGVIGKEALARILKEERIDRHLVGSPTARKALIESVKQVKAIVEIHGIPDAIHIELAREVGKSIEERGEIERGIEKRNKEKDKLRQRFEEPGMIGRPARNAEELLRFELWEQQKGFCLYSNEYISPSLLAASDNSVQVDHILPWSRFGDDSFHNKTLCIAKANQEKKGRTPFEWFSADKTPEEWDRFVASVQALPALKGMKRRNYLLKNALEVSERFRSRNLNDTRWTCRLLGEALKNLYPKDEGHRRVYARPGPLTDRLRRAWGLQWVKKDDKGERIPDDRHHALDAAIVAATSEAVLQQATKAIQDIERKGLPYDLKNVPEPWEGFRADVLDAVENVFVARAERRRARGKAHHATIRQIRERDGKEIVYERKKIADLEMSDLSLEKDSALVKDSERNQAMIESLRTWIDAGKPADRPPLSPKGDPIAKVRLKSKSKINVLLHRGGADHAPGTVDRGEMARVDVFRKATPKGVWQYFLVPIYPHEVATLDQPPDRAVTARKPESEWPVMDGTYEFLWSLVPMTYLQVVTGRGEIFEGYYQRMNRSVGAIALSPHHDSTELKQGIGARTLHIFKKISVTRLGIVHEIKQETRTWRGKASS